MTDALDVTSSAFDEGGAIPSRYTCDGDDVSPPITWSGAPEGTAAYALIVDDPDARAGSTGSWPTSRPIGRA